MSGIVLTEAGLGLLVSALSFALELEGAVRMYGFELLTKSSMSLHETRRKGTWVSILKGGSKAQGLFLESFP